MASDITEALQAARELTALLRVSANEPVARLLKAELSKKTTFNAYVATDGKATQAEVAKRAGITQPTVSKLWQRWLTLGLAVEWHDGRAKALFDPPLYGVTLNSVTRSNG